MKISLECSAHQIVPSSNFIRLLLSWSFSKISVTFDVSLFQDTDGKYWVR